MPLSLTDQIAELNRQIVAKQSEVTSATKKVTSQNGEVNRLWGGITIQNSCNSWAFGGTSQCNATTIGSFVSLLRNSDDTARETDSMMGNTWETKFWNNFYREQINNAVDTRAGLQATLNVLTKQLADLRASLKELTDAAVEEQNTFQEQEQTAQTSAIQATKDQIVDTVKANAPIIAAVVLGVVFIISAIVYFIKNKSKN